MGSSIATLALEDLDAVDAIEQHAYEYPWTKKQLAQQLQEKECNFGLWHDQQLVAYLMLQYIFPEAEILNIAVDPKYQGQKLGRMLLECIMNQLRIKKYQRLYLEVRPSNHSAIFLYEALGFNQIGLRKNYYPHPKGREDALLYGLELCF